jgi:hypothetical protein
MENKRKETLEERKVKALEAIAEELGNIWEMLRVMRDNAP